MAKSEKKITSKYKSRPVDIINKELTEKDKKIIDAVVKRVVREYGETLRLLGKGV